MAVCLVILVAPAYADNLRFGDTLTFSFGAMKHSADGSVVSNRPNLPTDRLTLKDLDLDDDDDILWANFNWQFSPRWQVGFGYSSLETQGITVAKTGGNFEGTEWEAGAVLASGLEMDLFIAEISYALLQKENTRLDLGLGVHAIDLDFGVFVGVFASVDGGGEDFVPVVFKDSDFFAPLPNLSLVGGHQIAEKVYLEGRAGWLSLSYDDYKGDLLSLRLSAEWRPWQRVGFGLGYQFVDVDVKVDRSRGREIYDVEFDGPILFMSVGF